MINETVASVSVHCWESSFITWLLGGFCRFVLLFMNSIKDEVKKKSHHFQLNLTLSKVGKEQRCRGSYKNGRTQAISKTLYKEIKNLETCLYQFW